MCLGSIRSALLPCGMDEDGSIAEMLLYIDSEHECIFDVLSHLLDP